MNIDKHVRNLEQTLGTPAFEAAYAVVARLTREEVNKIASLFVARTAKSASKNDSLRRIHARHADLVDLARKNAWQRGKGAA